MVRDAPPCGAPHHEDLKIAPLAPTLILRSPPQAGVSKDGPRRGRRHTFAFPRRRTSEFCVANPRENRGRRECRVFSCSRSPVCKSEKHTSLQVKPKHRHSLRDGFNAYLRALPGVHDLVVTVACRSSPADLAPAQGRQDHTPSPSATCAPRRSALAASIASRLTIVTTRSPLQRGGTAAREP
jgi:hypothetical protein